MHDFVAYTERQTAFESFGATSQETINLSGDGVPPERYQAASMTVGALRALRVKPLVGRLFRDGDDRPGADPVMLVAYDVWQERYGGQASVVGKAVRANGVARTIVGVMPDNFAFPDRERVWIPLEVNALATPRGQGPRHFCIGRLRDDVSIAQANTQLSAIAADLARQFPATNRAVGVGVMRILEGFLGPELYALLYTMLGAGIVRPILYSVSARDPLVIVSVVIALAGTTLLTGLLATRRVTRLNPVTALVTE